MIDFIRYIKSLIHKVYKYECVDYNDVYIGTVESSTSHSFVIRRDTFAPGLWAGLNNTPVQVTNEDYKFEVCVNFIDLNKAHIYYLGPPIKSGDKIYLPSLRIEYGRLR